MASSFAYGKPVYTLNADEWGSIVKEISIPIDNVTLKSKSKFTTFPGLPVKAGQKVVVGIEPVRVGPLVKKEFDATMVYPKIKEKLEASGYVVVQLQKSAPGDAGANVFDSPREGWYRPAGGLKVKPGDPLPHVLIQIEINPADPNNSFLNSVTMKRSTGCSHSVTIFEMDRLRMYGTSPSIGLGCKRILPPERPAPVAVTDARPSPPPAVIADRRGAPPAVDPRAPAPVPAPTPTPREEPKPVVKPTNRKTPLPQPPPAPPPQQGRVAASGRASGRATARRLIHCYMWGGLGGFQFTTIAQPEKPSVKETGPAVGLEASCFNDWWRIVRFGVDVQGLLFADSVKAPVKDEDYAFLQVTVGPKIGIATKIVGVEFGYGLGRMTQQNDDDTGFARRDIEYVRLRGYVPITRYFSIVTLLQNNIVPKAIEKELGLKRDNQVVLVGLSFFHSY